MILRNEWKYTINDYGYCVLEKRLDALLKYDEHTNDDGRYIVRSLYFDDYFNNSYYDNDMGVCNRSKWRIRYYNNNLDFIKLEHKVKHNDKGYKDSCLISKQCAQEIIEHGNQKLFKILYASENAVLKEFIIDVLKKDLRPKVIIEYNRKAYFDENSDIRITLDSDLNCSREVDNYLNFDYNKNRIIDVHKHILEIKVNDCLPDYIADVFDKRLLTRNSFSKYFNGRELLNRMMR